MICRDCKREIPENSIYCNWCGEKQLRERRKKGEIKVPTPKQLPSGSWNIVLRAEGQSVTEPTRQLCLTRARAIRAGILEQRKAAAEKGKTLRQAIEDYEVTYMDALSPSTVRGYDAIKKNRFAGKIDKPISDLSGWQKEIDLAAMEYAPKTVLNSWGLVARVLRENKIAVPEVKLPQQNRSAELPWLSYAQIFEFISAIRGTQFETGALLALHSLRRSEIFALSWDDINLERQTIRVSGARVMDRENKFVYKKANKNVSSQRTIRIMIPELLEILTQKKKKGDPILDCTENSLRGGINRACRKAGVPECGVHGLRRSFASLGFHVGMSELEIKEIGGWNDHNTIHKFYLRLAQEDRLNAENKMSEFYQRKETET